MPYYCKQQKPWNVVLGAGVAVLLIAVIEGSESSSAVMPCKVHDPNNGPCLMQQWQNIFINGIPGVNDLPSIDPYKPKSVRVSVDVPILNLNMTLKNVVVNGVSQAKVSNVSFTNEEKLKLTMTIPSMQIKGNYAMEGRMLLLNLNGKGPLDIKLVDVVVLISMKLKTTERDGEQFLEPLSLKTKVKHVGDMHLQFDNLFGDNQALTDSANEVFNQNWSEIIEVARPVIKETMDTSLLEQVQNLLSRVPVRLIFSDLS